MSKAAGSYEVAAISHIVALYSLENPMKGPWEASVAKYRATDWSMLCLVGVRFEGADWTDLMLLAACPTL